MDQNLKPSSPGLKRRIFEVVFESETRAGKAFDVILILTICLSVVAILLDSVESVRLKYGFALYRIEWVFTLLFTLEYIIRFFCVRTPMAYARSFFGVVDLLAILPSYFSLLYPGSHYLIVIRVLRVLRVFRVLRLAQYVGEANFLLVSLRASRRKIAVFLFTVLTLVIVLGSMIYLIEGEEHGFNSIPKSIYWAIVTLTTVGYGDMSPKTPLGQALASLVMIMGYGIIAVPTGIVTAEMTRTFGTQASTPQHSLCPQCHTLTAGPEANFCKKCGVSLI